jgi:hypothetical protein
VTFELASDGGVTNTELVFSDPDEAGEMVLEMLTDFAPTGQLPTEASCLAGMKFPLPFSR